MSQRSRELRGGCVFRVCSQDLRICVKFLRLLVKSYFQIRLDQFGLSRLSVRDDGCGVEKDEVPRMVQPHTTSKIRYNVSAVISDIC